MAISNFQHDGGGGNGEYFNRNVTGNYVPKVLYQVCFV